MSLFDQAALTRIEATVARVEERTAAEIAVVTVPRSDAYHDLRLLYATACAVTAAAWLHWFSPHTTVTALLWLQLTTVASVWLASGVGPVLRLLVPSVRTHASARRAAREAFLRHEVFATRARTGVLILVSELERCVVILGDSGIHARVQDSGWQEHVDRLVSAIRAGRAADGTCEVIEAIGAVLAVGVPVSADDTNELGNAVRRDDT